VATSEKRKPVLPKPGLFDGIGALDVLGSGTGRTLSPPKALSGRDKQHEDGKGFSAGSKKGIAITGSGVAAGASESIPQEEEQPATVEEDGSPVLNNRGGRNEKPSFCDFSGRMPQSLKAKAARNFAGGFRRHSPFRRRGVTVPATILSRQVPARPVGRVRPS